MFIDNLHQKATESGLKEDALIPKDSKKDQQIYNSVRDTLRPQSAATGKGTGDLKAIKEADRRQNSPTQTAMRSSFYSMSLLNEDERAEMDNEAAGEIAENRQKQDKERRGIVDQLNITNILELS